MEAQHPDLITLIVRKLQPHQISRATNDEGKQ
jgi:hypothetical protein